MSTAEECKYKEDSAEECKYKKDLAEFCNNAAHNGKYAGLSDVAVNMQSLYFPVSISSEAYDTNDALLKAYSKASSGFAETPEYIPADSRYDDAASTDFEKPFRKIILAAPGSGKTWLAKKLAMKYANDESGCFPVLLSCSQFTNQDEKDGMDFFKLAYSLSNVHSVYNNEQSFTEAIDVHKSSLILIVDGLDECSAEQRQFLAEKLTDFFKNNKNASLICTGRMRLYANEEIFSAQGAKYHYISRLDDAAVKAFIRKWLSNNEYAPEAIEENIGPIITSFGQCDDAIKSLLRTPMHLSKMLEMWKNSSKIPQSITQYFESYIALKNKALNDTNKQRFYMNFSKFLAYWMACHPERRHITIDEEELINVVKAYKVEKKVKRCKAEDVVENLEKMSMLISSSQAQYSFEHLAFQELLSAYAIKDGYTTDFGGYILKDETPVDFIRRMVYDSAWNDNIEIIRCLLLIVNDSTILDEMIYLLKKKGIYEHVKSP